MSGAAIALMTRGVVFCQEQRIEVVPLPATEGQNLLIQALELPLSKEFTEINGIHQSDLIIRTAVTMAIADMRANPWLLDAAFASLVCDQKTANVYGDKERQRAKEWFLRTHIPVVMDYRLVETQGTSISVTLVDSVETENTLGDIHHKTTEDMESDWPPLTAAFTPEAYSPATGVLKVPSSITDTLVIVSEMIILDRVGRPHEILEVLSQSPGEAAMVRIEAGTVADFSGSVIKGKKPKLITYIESLNFKESYRIGCHAHGEPFHLAWLHSIVVFILLRYKEALMEARGFERTTISSGPFAKNDVTAQENMWARFITITGFVRQSWPKLVQQRILSLGSQVLVSKNAGDPNFVPQDGYSEEDAPFLHEDGFGEPIK